MRAHVLPTLFCRIAAFVAGIVVAGHAQAFLPTAASLEQFDATKLQGFWESFSKSNPVMVGKGLSYLDILADGAYGFSGEAYQSCLRSGLPLVSNCVFDAIARNRVFDTKTRIKSWLGSRVFPFELLHDPLGVAVRLNDFFEYQVRNADPESYNLESRIEQEAGLSRQQKIGFRLAQGVVYQLKQSCNIGLHSARLSGVSTPFPLRYGDKLLADGPEGIYACKSKVAVETCNALTLIYAGNVDRQMQETLLPTLRSVCRLTDENGAFIEEKRGRDN